ncbi:MAG: 6-phosphofructokinase [Bacteroidota bacterium]
MKDKTKVILIGTKEYDNFNPIYPTDNNLNDLAQVFSDKNIIGIEPSNIQIITSSSKDTLEKISNICKSDINLDTIIIYYVGHGIKLPDSKIFYFSTKETNEDRLEKTAISYREIKKIFDESSHIQKKVLIIDSCYSGILALNVDNDELIDIENAKGTYIIASCSANDRSFYKQENKYTNFTKELISILTNGINNNKDTVTLNEIFHAIENNLENNIPKQKPTKKVIDLDDLIFALNKYYINQKSKKQDFRFYEKDIIDYYLNKIKNRSFISESVLPSYWPKVEHWKGEKKNELKEDIIGKYRSDDAEVLVAALSDYHCTNTCLLKEKLSLPEAGPREYLYYPQNSRRMLNIGIVISGGIAPGINSVIDGIVQRHKLYSIEHKYDIEIIGYNDGFYSFFNKNKRIIYKKINNQIKINEDTSEIANDGGSFLKTSRYEDITGNDKELMNDLVDKIYNEDIDILYVIGGDGSMRAANAIWEHAQLKSFIKKYRYKLSVIGVPKTMDNDILWIWQTFGFLSAVEKAREVIEQISVEIKSNPRIGIIQLFGSDSGFVVSHAVLASKSGVCDLALIPEYKYKLCEVGDFLIEKFISKRDESFIPKALIVMAETAIPEDAADFVKYAQLSTDEEQALTTYLSSEGFSHQIHERNDNLRSAGLKIVKAGLKEYFKRKKDVNNENLIAWDRIRFFTNEPRHVLRAIRPSCSDVIFAQRLGTLAVDNALAGYTNFMISQWLTEYVLVPLPLVILGKKRIPTSGVFWKSVLAKTNQFRITNE